MNIQYCVSQGDPKKQNHRTNVSEVNESCLVVSSSLRPHGLYSPCNSPGQDTGEDQSVSQSVQLLSCVLLFVTPRTAVLQASLSITNSRSLSRLISIESIMPYNHIILCRPLLLLPSIFRSIRVFSKESTLHIRWPKCWSFSFSISLPMNTQD